MKKLPPNAIKIVMPLVISIIMSCIVSLVSTYRAIGPVDGFAYRWLSAWLISWCIAFPTLFIVMPVARRITEVFVKSA